jgi:hypothetical protein
MDSEQQFLYVKCFQFKAGYFIKFGLYFQLHFNLGIKVMESLETAGRGHNHAVPTF